MIRLISFGAYAGQIEKAKDLEELKSAMSELIKNIQEEYDYIYKRMMAKEDLPGVAGTFTSSDGKTITVENGIVMSIK